MILGYIVKPINYLEYGLLITFQHLTRINVGGIVKWLKCIVYFDTLSE